MKLRKLVMPLALASSALNIVPIIPVSLLVLLFQGLIQTFRTGRIILFQGTAKWYTIFLAVSLIYCMATGVRIWEPSLYRRELKYFIPFVAFLLFNNMNFPRSLAPAILVMIKAIVGGSILFMFISFFFRSEDLSSIYVYDGNMWTGYSGSAILYSGQFISHSAFGGFLCSIIMVLLGYLLHASPKIRDRVLVLYMIVAMAGILYLSRSRAFAVGTLAIAPPAVMLTIWRGRAVRLLVYAGAVIAIIAMFAQVLQGSSSVDLSEGMEQTNDVADQNVYVRYFLWANAIQDFLKSPIIGIGISRFDDNYAILGTLAEYRNLMDTVPKEPRFFDAPLVHVEIDKFQAHTDQHAHNIYLHQLAEGGILLFGLTFWLFFSTVRGILRYAKKVSGPEQGLAMGVCYSYFAVAIGSFFGDNLFAIIPMFFLSSLAGYLHSRSRMLEARAPVPALS
jgi:O-antigen ligase